ncbi:MAG: Asp-tRNA(Asn)/Glu-tRNA(Gln) amidotransferase GatCAB subunit B, partial [Pseudoramibacter alactolyticus]|nr:Asp-tRNA(Asn)/Glu-tRNA(Gln) amidotransferase GatCAB subunit B [Pseudoramibacter alactolyticus]
ERAVRYESKRQIIELKKGHRIIQETRKWDDAKGVSSSMRSKEDAQDYRYFPEPDLVPIVITDEQIAQAKSELPELPEAKKARYVSEFGLPEYDAEVLTVSKETARFFEETVAILNEPKQISNWLMVDIPAHLKERELTMAAIPFAPKDLAELIAMIDDSTISGKIAKKVMDKMFEGGETSPRAIVEANHWAQMSDTGALTDVVAQVIADNPKSIADIAAGNKKAYGFLTGQVMKATKGQANPQMANQIIRELVEKELKG